MSSALDLLIKQVEQLASLEDSLPQEAVSSIQQINVYINSLKKNRPPEVSEQQAAYEEPPKATGVQALLASIRKDKETAVETPVRPATVPAFLTDISAGAAKAKKPLRKSSSRLLGNVPSVTGAANNGAAEIPPELKPPVNPPESLVAKPISWTGFTSKAKIEGTIWERLHNPPFRFQVNYDEINEVFFEREQDTNIRHSSVTPAAATEERKKKSVLECPRRIQHIEIAIKGLGLVDDFSVVSRALENLDLGDEIGSNGGETDNRWCLTPYKVERLLSIFPSKEEIVKLEEVAGSTDLATADRFLLSLIRIPRFRETASCLLTYYSFDRFHPPLGPKLDKFQEVVSEVLKSTASNDAPLSAIFSLILRIGNYVNLKTRRPLVWGLQCSALEGLRSIKGHRGKSLFRFIAEHIEDQPGRPSYLSDDDGKMSESSIWDEISWLPQCCDVADISMDDLTFQLKEFERKFDELENELKITSLESFKTKFSLYVKRSRATNASIKSCLENCKKLLAEFTTKAGETGAKTSTEQLLCLKRVGVFGRELLAAHRELVGEREVLEKKKQRERFKATTPSRRQRQQSVTRRDPEIPNRLTGVASLVSTNKQRPATPFRESQRDSSTFARGDSFITATSMYRGEPQAIPQSYHHKSSDLLRQSDYKSTDLLRQADSNIRERTKHDDLLYPPLTGGGTTPISSATLTGLGASINPTPSSHLFRSMGPSGDYRARPVWTNNTHYYDHPEYVYYVDRPTSRPHENEYLYSTNPLYDLKYRRNLHNSGSGNTPSSSLLYRNSSMRNGATPSSATPADSQFFPSRFYNRS